MINKRKIFFELKTIIKEFSKFGIVGVLNTIVDLSIIYICMELLNIPALISNIIGNIAGLINSFILNKFWTFKSKRKSKKEIFLFLVVFFISFAVRIGIFILLVNFFNIDKRWSQFFSMVSYTLINFPLNKWITFRKSEK